MCEVPELLQEHTHGVDEMRVDELGDLVVQARLVLSDVRQGDAALDLGLVLLPQLGVRHPGVPQPHVPDDDATLPDAGLHGPTGHGAAVVEPVVEDALHGVLVGKPGREVGAGPDLGRPVFGRAVDEDHVDGEGEAGARMLVVHVAVHRLPALTEQVGVGLVVAQERARAGYRKFGGDLQHEFRDFSLDKLSY